MRMTSDLVHIMNNLVKEGVTGIVVLCGTDNLEEMAYLTDLLWAYPQPVIFTGAVLPPDIVGSDASINITQAIVAANSEACWGLGILACFQDQLFAASEITQMSNHRRSAFHAPDRGPVAEIVGNEVFILRLYKRPKILEGDFSPARNVELLWTALGTSSRLIGYMASEKEKSIDGLVIAALGNGNIPPSWIPHVKTLLKDNVPIVLTSRCISGHVRKMYSFEGSVNRLLEMGVMTGGNLSPVHARLKLAVALGAGLTGNDIQNYMIDK
jgi:L-asparaginase